MDPGTKKQEVHSVIVTTHFIHKIVSAIQRLTSLSNVLTSFHVQFQPHFGVPNSPRHNFPCSTPKHIILEFV